MLKAIRRVASRKKTWLAVSCLGGVIAAGLVVAAAANLLDASGSDTASRCLQGACVEPDGYEFAGDPQVLSPAEELERLGRAPPVFLDVAAKAGVAFEHRRDNDFLNLGGGAAVADFNNDGWLDLYVSNSSGPNALYRNNGDGTFTDVAARAAVDDPDGRGNGAAWGDYDNDGWLDLFVANYGASKLFRSDGDGTFSDVTRLAGVGDPGLDFRTTGAVWGDFDADGYLDLLVLRHLTFPPALVSALNLQPELLNSCGGQTIALSQPEGRSLSLYRNTGEGAFTDVTSMLGADSLSSSNLKGAGFKPSFLDYDNDGDLDVYVVNDFGRENHANVLWRNDGAGGSGRWRFVDMSSETGTDLAMYGMGLGAGDYDNDGDLDLYVTDIGASRFLENRGGVFDDVTRRTGTGRGTIPENGEADRSIGWGATFADFDNDSWLDLYLVAGYIDSDPCLNQPNQPNGVFVNNGDGSFADVSKSSGAGDPGIGREVVAADFNNDGLLDVYVVNLGSRHGDPGIARLFLNTTQTGNGWLKVEPLDRSGNRLALGARVRVTAGGMVRIQDVGLSQGHMSQSLLPAHFGLGDVPRIDEVEVRWPSGVVQRFHDVPVGAVFTVREP